MKTIVLGDTHGRNHWEDIVKGDETCQTPIWVRPESLEQDAIEDYIQVMGHTTRPITIKDKFIYVDSLFYRQYLVIEDNSLIIKTF